MRLLLATTFAALAALAWHVHVDANGGPYKCRGMGTTPVYQDEPCAPGRELRNFATDPPNVSVIPFVHPSAPPSPRAATRSERPPRSSAKAAKARPAVDPAERRHLKEGMTEGEVLARLGAPDLQSGKGGRKASWTYLPVAGDAQTVTLVRFENGRVDSVERRVVR
jgi:hypothetical protein